MIQSRISKSIYVYYHDTTTNQSFMDMYYYLKAKGIKNNKFFLTIYDPALMGVDPRDPNLTYEMKVRVLRECTINFWYFIREVIRIPVEGGTVGSGARYKLHRGNLAMNYLFVYNYDQFVELPRQHFKTISAVCWYLWIFNFGSTNTKMMFMNKKHEDSKKNLKDLKNIRSELPDYLQMDAPLDRNGKKIKATDRAETLQNPINGNIILTLPAARTKQQADGAGRGATMAIQYYDEFGFMPYNEVIYGAAFPAFSRAKQNAKQNHAPYGILITTTPGDMSTNEGKYANQFRLDATDWNEKYYDNTYEEMEELRNSNPNSTFFHIRYMYQQLGSGNEYFMEMVRGYHRNWSLIRREVLLEWANMSDNCPFSQENLDIIKSYLVNDPVDTIFFGKARQYQLKIWSKLERSNMYPPIIGVDVAGAMQQDSSAITIIDSKTTKVIATLNSNFIPSDELAQIVFDIVTKYMPNAIVNVERNGGFGASVLQLLVKSKIKNNLYFEIKDRVLEERTADGGSYKRKQKIKCYGTDNSKDVRNQLIEILHQRVERHKDKFLAPILHDELTTMRVKKNGKTEHADDCHDDQIFSYLMALYVWYLGDDLAENFRIIKTEIETDLHEDDSSFSLEERYGGLDDITENIMQVSDEDSMIQEVEEQLSQFNPSKSIEDFYKEQKTEYNRNYQELISTKIGRKAYSEKYNISEEDLSSQYKSHVVDIGDIMLSDFYGEDDYEYSVFGGNLGKDFSELK